MRALAGDRVLAEDAIAIERKRLQPMHLSARSSQRSIRPIVNLG